MENKSQDHASQRVPQFPSARTARRVEALHDINFEVEDAFSPDGRDVGEFRVLLGPSGCGKSTMSAHDRRPRPARHRRGAGQRKAP